MDAPVVWRERHRAGGDDYVRDFHGRFADAPGGAPDVPLAGDKLKLAGRIELGPGETLAGSAAVPHSGLVGAAVDSPSGRRVRLGIGIHPDDVSRWKGSNRGSTVVLDERGVADLRTSLEQMRAAGAEGKKRNAEFDRRGRALKAREEALMGRQYPRLSKAEVAQVAAGERELRDRQADIDGLNARRREILDRIPSAADRSRIVDLDEQIRQARLAGGYPEELIRERRALLGTEPDRGDLAALDYIGAGSDIFNAEADQFHIRERLAPLTANRAPLQRVAVAELEQVRADMVRNDSEWAAFNNNTTLAAGSVAGEWGAVRWRTGVFDGEVEYELGAAPNDGPLSDEDVDASKLRKLSGLLDTLTAEPSARESHHEGGLDVLATEADDEVLILVHEAIADVDTDEELTREAIAVVQDWDGEAELEDVVEGGWDPTAHPHAPAGSAAGGQFTASGGATAKAGNAPAKQGAGNAPKRKGGPALGYDAKSGRGTGYGKPGGDARVKKLQASLNRLGLKDADGRALKLDGKLGPRTTAAIKAAQRKLGVPADGKVTPQLLAKLVAAKSLTKKAKTPAKKAPAKKAAPAKAAPRTTTTTTTTSSGGRKVTVTSRAREADMPEQPEGTYETTDRIEGVVLGATEGVDGGRAFRVRIISAGDSKNGRRYPAAVLREAAEKYEGAKAYDHHRSAEELRSSTINGLVGYYRNVEAHDEGLDGDLCLLPGASHTAEALDATVAAQAAGLPPLVGISHDAVTYTRPVTSGRRRLVEAVSIAKVNSADVVADPAAGGKAVRVLAGGIEETDPADAGESNEEEDVVTSQSVLAALKDASPEDLAAVGLSKVDTPTETATVAQTTESAPAGFAKSEFMAGLMIREKAAAAGLPDRVVESLREALPDRVTESDVDAQIAALKSVMGIAERSGLAPTATAVVTQEALEKKTAALDAFFNGDFTTGYRSFRDAYLDITGYRPQRLGEDLNKRIMRESIGDLYDSGDRVTESLTSSSWNLVLGDSITRKMVAAYAHPSLQTWRAIVSSTVPVNDFRTQRIDRVGGYGVLPTVNQGAPYQPLTSPGNEEVTYALAKKGGTEDITLEMIANDDVRAISNIPKKLGLAAARTLHNFVWDFILTNPTIYDTNTLFHASHNNTTVVALGQSTVSQLRAKMRDQTSYGDTSDILSLVPKILLVPNELEELAFQIATSAVAIPATPAGASNTPNLHQGLQPIVLDYDTDANDWFLIADPDMCPTIEVGFYQGRQDPELFTQSDPSVGSMFNSDTLTYKIRHIYSGAVLDFRAFQRGTQP
jgi:peptidoglycan hydrolase-like protein with peptidoglycan-binding domain